MWDQCQVCPQTVVFPRESWGTSLWGAALSERRSFLSEGPFRTPEGHIPVQHFLATPILLGEVPIGLLCVANRSRPYTELDKSLLESIAAYISPILDARLAREREEAERLRAEQAVRRSEENLRRAQAVARTGSWRMDIVHGRAECSAEACRICGCAEGVPVSREQMVAITHPDDREWILQAWEAALLGAPLDVEYRIVVSGQTRWIRECAEVVFDSDGNAVEAIGTTQEITERKRSEQILLARVRLSTYADSHAVDEVLRATIDEAEALTGSCIGFYHFLEADQRTLCLQNWSTRTVEHFCTAEGKGEHYDLDRAGVWVDCIHQCRPVIHNDYASLPHRKGMPEGHAVVVRELAVPVFRGEKIVAVLGVGNKATDYNNADVKTVSLLADLAWDIAERKLAEEEARALNILLEQRVQERTSELERQTSILGAINRVFHEALTSKSDVQVAAAFLEVARELTGSTVGFINEVNAQGDLDAIALNHGAWEACETPTEEAVRLLQGLRPRSYWGRVIRTGCSQIVNHPEADPDRRGTPDGHTPITRFLGVPMLDGERVIGVIGLANRNTDYTEEDRQAAETVALAFVEALVRHRAQRAVLCLSQELAARAQALEQVNGELESFSYSVSHDLRAPLRHIDGFLELLQQRLPPEVDERSRHYMEMISDAANRMQALIDDLLSFSRMGRHAMANRPVDLAALVREVIRELESETGGRAIGWRIGDLPSVLGDRSMLKIVMVNLLSNAVKFTRGCEHAEIEVGYLPSSEGQAIVLVRDNGVGFDMQYADRLFGVFQRLHRAEEFEGTGIGLASVRRIVHRHGGRTWAEAKVNEGATFFFSLPRAPEET